MKQNVLVGFIVVLMSFINVSHADFTLHSSTANACDDVPGRWAGSGKASNWLIGDCFYNGLGTVSAVDNAGRFTLEVSADKRSGSIVCPDHHTTKLYGVCVNGAVTIRTEYGNLGGNFSKNTGNAKGSLTVSPGMDVDVTIQFQRVG